MEPPRVAARAKTTMMSLAQKAFGSPACLRIALAVWRLGIPIGTGKFRRVIGLYQIS